MDPKDLYSPIYAKLIIWRHIPIVIHVFDTEAPVIPVQQLRPGAIHYAVPEPCDENTLRNELYEILEFCLAIPAPPAGANRAQLKSVSFSKHINRDTRDHCYPLGINPIAWVAAIPDLGDIVYSQTFITRQDVVKPIVNINNQIDPEFLALV